MEAITVCAGEAINKQLMEEDVEVMTLLLRQHLCQKRNKPRRWEVKPGTSSTVVNQIQQHAYRCRVSL